MIELISQELLDKRIAEKNLQKKQQQEKDKIYHDAIINDICPVCGGDLITIQTGWDGLIFKDPKFKRFCSTNKSHFHQEWIRRNEMKFV